MANQEIALTQMKAPAYLTKKSATELAEFNQAAATGTLGGPSVNRISIKQSRFRLIKGGQEVAVLPNVFLDLVILRASNVLSKTYFEKAWTPGQEPEAPACYSEDGIRPAPDAKKKQHSNCAECPHNQWGSKINPQTGADGKKCADSKRLSVVPFDDVASDPFQLSVPAASMKDFGAYMTKLSAVSPPAPYNAVVTRVSFDTDATFPKLLFSAVRYLTEAEYSTVDARYDDDDVKITAAIPGAGFSPAAQAAAEAAEVAAQPAPEPEQEVIKDPEPTGGWGAAATEAKPNTKAAATAGKPKRTRTAKPKAEPAAEPKPEPAAASGGWGAAAAATPASAPVQRVNDRPVQSKVVEAATTDDIEDLLSSWDLEEGE